jgi:hypothetical protein
MIDLIPLSLVSDAAWDGLAGRRDQAHHLRAVKQILGGVAAMQSGPVRLPLGHTDRNTRGGISKQVGWGRTSSDTGVNLG